MTTRPGTRAAVLLLSSVLFIIMLAAPGHELSLVLAVCALKSDHFSVRAYFFGNCDLLGIPPLVPRPLFHDL